jgi:predicted transcriptional regulator
MKRLNGTAVRNWPNVLAGRSRRRVQRFNVADMSFTLWLSAEEERVLERIMRQEGARTKEQAVIKAILDKGARLEADRQAQVTPVRDGALPGLSAPLGA